MTFFFLLFTVLALAYANGANDNFKGVATLFGSGACSFRKALSWATVTTLAGSLLAMVLAHGLVENFKGRGLVPEAVTRDPTFLLSVALGAALTVLLATFTGMPISTTHALTGALVGAGLCATGGEVVFSALGKSFVLPLLASPLLALTLTVVVYPIFRAIRRGFAVTKVHAILVDDRYQLAPPQLDGTVAVAANATGIESCERYEGDVLGVPADRIVDVFHYFSGGAVGFARGLNDTPKIVALLVAGEATSPGCVSSTLALLLVALSMAIGGVFNSRKVAETMSTKITRMNAGQGFTANLVTALLVTLASPLGLPVSTTHVSCGSLFGIGLVNGTAKLKTIATILLAWVTTLPAATALAAAVYATILATGIIS